VTPILRRYVAALFLAAALAGCAGQRAETPAPRVNLSGYSAEFKQGYADGCSSASGAVKRDAARFDADSRYARGWQDGYAICRK